MLPRPKSGWGRPGMPSAAESRASRTGTLRGCGGSISWARQREAGKPWWCVKPCWAQIMGSSTRRHSRLGPTIITRCCGSGSWGGGCSPCARPRVTRICASTRIVVPAKGRASRYWR
jgi:hypothetical protein